MFWLLGKAVGSHSSVSLNLTILCMCRAGSSSVPHLAVLCCACIGFCLSSATALTVPWTGINMPKLEPSQITVPFVVENAKAVAGIGMAVLGAGFLVMILLSLLGNHGLSHNSSDEAYAPAAGVVEVHAHRPGKVRDVLDMHVLCLGCRTAQQVVWLSTTVAASSRVVQSLECNKLQWDGPSWL